jgi:hypothetical protein
MLPAVLADVVAVSVSGDVVYSFPLNLHIPFGYHLWPGEQYTCQYSELQHRAVWCHMVPHMCMLALQCVANRLESS